MLLISSLLVASCLGYNSSPLRMSMSNDSASRRSFISKTAGAAAAFGLTTSLSPQQANAIGPVRVDLINPTYKAAKCPPSRPIPGEKAMKGLRGLCVTVQADIKSPSPKTLEKVGVYGYVVNADTGDSVLANNPDLGSDAGQFAIIEQVTPKDTKVEFEFVAAIPMETDITKFDNGIGNVEFKSLRLVSFPGGQQYGDISPCEMDEFSMECEDWEEENGKYKKADYMVKSNPRTKGY